MSWLPRRRTIVLAVVLLLVLADQALGAGGGGSSGFGGGGGGFSGGGGGFSGGGGYSGSGGGRVSPVLLVLIFGFFGLFVLFAVVKAWRIRAKREARHTAVVGQAAVAADDDAAFDAEAVAARARELFAAVQVAWDQRDEAALAQLAGPELLEEWRRRLADFRRKGWHNRVRVTGDIEVAYVGLVNRADDADDRVVVWVAAPAEDYVQKGSGGIELKQGAKSKATRISEFWTLTKHEGAWRVQSIESYAEGVHHLEGDIVTTPWGDDARLHDEAVAERAFAEALPEGTSPAEVADLDFEGPARTAAQDLALADGRFDPALIEASVRRAVDAWVTAVDGADDALEAAATPEAVQALLHPGDASRTTRLVVRGARVASIAITGLDAAAEPPALWVEVQAEGRRYVEDRDTAAVVSGNREGSTRFTEQWTLVLDGEGEWPWRIGAVAAPSAR